MRILRLALWTLAVVSRASAWDCDDRCPDYEECLQEQARKRNARRGLDDSLRNKDTIPQEETLNANPNLRGRQMGVVTETYFMLKMYHEESTEYCWQSEWADRGWCLECEEPVGSYTHSCDQGDRLWIQYCKTEVNEQYYVYEPVASTGGGKIKPYTRQDLCLEKVSEEQDTLKFQPCNDVSTLQILVGFDMYTAFELSPYSDTSECLSQAHHPKKEEVIKAYPCDVAQDDKTSLWQAYEAVVEYDPLGTPVASPIESPVESPIETLSTNAYETTNEQTTTPPPPSNPQLEDIGDCSPTSPCGACTGDCDTNADCEGELECYHRAYNETVPSCSGGEALNNQRDFCIPPEYNNRPQVQDNGWNGCSASSPCPQCFGDCDEDYECAGNLVCYKRDPGEAVPSCRGGEMIDERTDFCVPPEYNREA